MANRRKGANPSRLTAVGPLNNDSVEDYSDPIQAATRAKERKRREKLPLIGLKVLHCASSACEI
jgi:hypothetical protein